eukprot:111518_1
MPKTKLWLLHKPLGKLRTTHKKLFASKYTAVRLRFLWANLPCKASKKESHPKPSHENIRCISRVEQCNVECIGIWSKYRNNFKCRNWFGDFGSSKWWLT